MVRTHLVVTLLLLLPLIAAQTRLAGDCLCGYNDVTTGAIWTDAIITYFNETDAGSSIVTSPDMSPYIQGHLSAGTTGNGTQDWSIVGDQTDEYEDAFGSTYRDAVLYNNTGLRDSALQMLVQPARSRDRIVYGAEFVTRRRDILYGSFRASMNVQYLRDSGTGFQMSAKYNTSETVDLGLFSSDLNNESTLQWSYSARDTDAQPVSVPFSSLLGASNDGFLEHRFDWKSDSILYGNNNTNTNISASSLLVTRDSSHAIPSTPVPISFRHWSDGNPQTTEGPPLFQAKVARLRYARFFFNSSLSSRQQEFTSQCSSSPVAVCSTDDLTLRGSTAFSQLSTLTAPPYIYSRPAPRYSLYGMTVSGGLIILLVIHGLVKNFILRRNARIIVVSKEGHSSSGGTATIMVSSLSKISPVEVLQLTTSEDMTKEASSPQESVKTTNSSSQSIPHKTSSNNLLIKWNAASLAQAQLGQTGEDSDEEEDDSDDEGFLQDQREETDITNDDGLGRPDRIHHHGHNDSVSSDRTDLPQHNLSYGMADFTTQLDPYMNGDIHFRSDAFLNEEFMPTMPTQVALNSQESEDGEYLARLHPHPSAWRSSFDQGLPSQDYPVPVSLKRLSARKSTSSSFTLNSEKVEVNPLRRSSIISLNAIAMANSSIPMLHSEAPSISIWTRSKDIGKEESKGDVMAARIKEKKELDRGNVEGHKSWWRAAYEYAFILEGGNATTTSGGARISYLEGLRGFACFLVSLNHFMLMFWFAATTEGAPTHTNGFEVWFYRLISPVFFNQGTKIGIFFVLPARVMGTRYMLKGNLQDVADSTLRRIPRLAFPTFAAVLINYFFIQVDAYQWVRRLPSRTWSIWAYYQDFDSIGSFINAWIGLWFTLPPQNPVLLSTYATGVLWTIPVITQSSFAILITVIVSKELPNVYKRYGFYLSAMVLSWYANRFDYYFIAGLVIADMDNKLKYRQAAAQGIPLVPLFLRTYLPGPLQRLRVHGQVIGWILFLGGSLVQYLEYLDLPGGHFNIWEHGILPDFPTAQPRVWAQDPLSENYNDPRFSLFCMVIGIFVLCDLSKAFSGFFMLRWWGALGRNGFSLYLLHGTIFWTWGAWLCLLLLKAGTPYWATILIVFVTSYFLLAIVCELFTRTFDAWGVSISKAMWRYTSGGLGRRD